MLVKKAQRINETAVEWLESKDKGQINCIRVKHILSDLSHAVEGTEVVVKFASRRYQLIIIDLLEWQPPKRHRKRKDTCTGEQPLWSSGKKMKYRRVVCKRPKSSTAKNSRASKRSTKAIKPLSLPTMHPPLVHLHCGDHIPCRPNTM